MSTILKLTLLAKGSKSVLFLSDLHVGSAYAVCTPNPSIGDLGTTYRPNKLQKKLYSHWLKIIDSLQQKPYILCLNGEGVDGANVKQIGAQSWTTNITDQLDDTERLLRIIPYDKIIMSRGSGYHVAKDATNYDEMLAKRLDAIPYSGYFETKEWDENRNKSTRTDYYIDFELNGRVFDVTHHIGFTKWESYKPTALAREMANLEYLRGRYWKDKDFPTFIIRSHVHYFVMIRFSSQCGLTTPCFKFPDSYLYRGGMAGTAPSIGAIEVIVESNGKWQVNPLILDNEHYPKHNVIHF